MIGKRLLVGIVIITLISMSIISCGNNENNSESNTELRANVADNSSTEEAPVVGQSEMKDDSDTFQEPTVTETPMENQNGETYKTITENTFIETVQEKLSTFSIDVDTASYANVRDIITGGATPNPDAVRIEEMINYFEYDYEKPMNGDPFNIVTKTTQTPWNEDSLVTMIGLKGKDLMDSEIPPSNIVMLIDVSGSMHDEDKLPLLKEAFNELTNQLTQQDRVSIVVYAGASGLVLEGAQGSDNEEIMDALYDLKAGGSTAGGEGIELAYKIAEKYFIENGNNRVILASDGDFNVGLSSLEALEELISIKRETGVFLSVVGFGRGNTRDDVMETLADKGNGNYSYIDSYEEAKKVFGTEFLGTMFVIAKDVKIQVDFNDETVKSYRLIGYENRVMANQDFYDDRKDAGELGSGHEVTALYELILHDGVDESQAHLYDIKLRYKEPNEEQSQALDVSNQSTEFVSALDEEKDFKWALTVAEFAMILRDSEFKGNASLDHVRDSAREVASLNDVRRLEFITIVERYSQISGDQQ